MQITLDWLGTATFRLTIGDLVLFLDAYMDRLPAAPPVGLTTAEITRADWVLVGHSHFDHLAGADTIALNTGARIIASNESCRIMRERGVPEAQLFPSQGGERHRLAPDVTVRVFPSLHACTWVLSGAGCGDIESGHTRLTQDERAAVPGLVQHITQVITTGGDEGQAVVQHIRTSVGSLHDGGPLVYLIETPQGAVFYQDTSGCWTGVLSQLRADVAILGASARANVDGEPIQGSLAQFLVMEAKVLEASTVILGHHDDWMPPVTRSGFDIDAVRAELGKQAPQANLLELTYLDATPLLQG